MLNSIARLLPVLILAGLFVDYARAENGPPSDPSSEARRKTVHLTVDWLPRPDDARITGKGMSALQKRFREKYPWISMSMPVGIWLQIPGWYTARRPMQIAGKICPDVIPIDYSFIAEGFLYPLDQWWERLPEKERRERMPPQVKDVVFTYGPAKKKITPEEWERFARNVTNVPTLRVRPEGREEYATFLERTHNGSIERLNERYGANYTSFRDISYPEDYVTPSDRLADWTAFLQVAPLKYVYHKDGRDINKHYWGIPHGLSSTTLLWRKDVFQKFGLDPERPPRTWDEFYDFAKRCTDPKEGTYGIVWRSGGGPVRYEILASAGARVMEKTEGDDWRVAFNSEEGVAAFEFLLKLQQAPFRRPDGRIVEGVVALRAQAEARRLYEGGRAAMRADSLETDLVVNQPSFRAELEGVAPIPIGNTGKHFIHAETRLYGIFSGTAAKGQEALDAAWQYAYFVGSDEAFEAKTKAYVEHGYGTLANPKYLARLGYGDYIRRIPAARRELVRRAREEGVPAAHSPHMRLVSRYMTSAFEQLLDERVGRWAFDAVERRRKELNQEKPDISAEETRAELAKVEAKAWRKARERIKDVLDETAAKAEQRILGIIPPREMRKRRIVAGFLAAACLVAFVLLFRHVIKAFTPPEAKGGWMFKKYWMAYLLMILGVGSIALWQYFPMARGALMAFQDYHIVLPTEWVGLDNFANVLWETEFWDALWVSAQYALLSIAMGFFAPIILAILLHEIPKGKVLFRTIYYLPAVISGLVVMLMWKNFFEPSNQGLLNQVIMSIGPKSFLILGGILTVGLGGVSYFNFRQRRRVAGPIMGVLALACAAIFLMLGMKVGRMPGAHLPAQQWLQDRHWAMFCVVLPTVWAGMGPGCLIYLAALKTIPEDLYEAADIDGAGFFSKIWHITIPTIKVLIIIQFIGAVVGAFRTAGYILAMTGGGPNRATEVMALKIFYDAFVFLRFGTATAMAWILGFFLIGFTVFQLKRLSKVEFRTAG